MIVDKIEAIAILIILFIVIIYLYFNLSDVLSLGERDTSMHK